VDTKRFQIRLRVGFGACALALMSASELRWSDASAGTPPTYSVDFYSMSAGGSSMRGSCFLLSGTLGQAAPGYSSGGTFYVTAGYWQAVLQTAPTPSDEIFFNGFEGCSP
jgi:hypothetical protein